MDYQVEGKTIIIPDESIVALMDELELSKDEAIQLWLEDQKYLEDEKLFIHYVDMFLTYRSPMDMFLTYRSPTGYVPTPVFHVQSEEPGHVPAYNVTVLPVPQATSKVSSNSLIQE